ncbi:MAG TPA: hypothetical protein VLL82_12890 [Mycobacterium sp.]|nr:hypothetical protein [Mycobacterium sp.]
MPLLLPQLLEHLQHRVLGRLLALHHRRHRVGVRVLGEPRGALGGNGSAGLPGTTSETGCGCGTPIHGGASSGGPSCGDCG